MYSKAVPTEGYDKLKVQWEHGVFLGVDDSSRELVIGTSNGVIKAAEVRRKGSEEERWSTSEIEKLHGLPWQLGPNATGMEVQSRDILPIKLSVSEKGEPDIKLVIARGIAV